MRILQVGKFYHPSAGGMETVLRNLSEGLVEAGHEITVLCSARGSRSVEERIGGVNVVRAPTYGSLLSQPLSPALAREIRRLARGHDIVHVHTPNPLAESLSLALPRDARIVATYHSDIVRQKLALRLYSPLLARFLLRARRLAVATPNHVEHSPYLARVRSKCRVIPFGFDPRDFEPNSRIRELADELRARHGRFALFVGRLVGYKGLAYLIRAMRGIDARLVVVGEGPMRVPLEVEAVDAGVIRQVVFEDRIADPELLAAHYHGCELLVLPSISRAEAFGLVQLEAMAWKKPVVSTILPSGITQVGEHGVTGLQIPPADSDALREAIRSLLSDEARRAAMGEAGRRRFEERFTRRRMIEGYEALYTETMES